MEKKGMRLIDANELDGKLEALVRKYTGQGRPEVAKEYSFVQTILLTASTVDAVAVARLGKLGKLMMPYKGDPRGRIGPRFRMREEEKSSVIKLDVIEDVDGNWWVPVLEDDLRYLQGKAARAVEVVHAHWEHLGGDEWCCTACGEVIHTEGSWEKPTKKFCYECGAKMDAAAAEGSEV